MSPISGDNPDVTVLDAARALLSAHDRGFNGRHPLDAADVGFVRDILAQPRIDTAQLEALKKALEKYRDQLATMGYDHASLVVFHTPWRGVRLTPQPAAPGPGPRPDPGWLYTAEEALGHFPSGRAPRDRQTDAIRRINGLFEAGKRIVALEMPTGGGKSFICYSFADMVRQNGGCHFITISKPLQAQYQRDFPAPQIEVLKGRANYECTHPEAEPGADAAYGVCTRRHRGILPDCVDPSKVRLVTDGEGMDEDQERKLVARMAVALQVPPEANLCPYWRQLQVCKDVGVTLFNFASFLWQQRIGRFERRALMVVDECHNIEAELMKFVSMEITGWALSLVGARITRTISTKEEFVEWIRQQELVKRLEKTLGTLGQLSEDNPEGFAQFEVDAMRSLQAKLEIFMRFLDTSEWALETVEYDDRRGDKALKIVARPLYARAFARDLLFDHADRVLVMSATILDIGVWARSLGLSPDEVGHVQTECDFPVENRPVFLTYAGNCGGKHIDQTRPRLVESVKTILERHSGQRGIIHTHSFDLSKLVRKDVASPRFLFQDQFGEDKDKMLEEHARRPDSVIVAPAMAEGVDLKDDLGRFQIILKVPWPWLGDKVVAERKAKDERWYGWLACLKLVQSLGRTVRCFDRETQILTLDGWKDWKTLAPGDVAFGVNPAAFGKGKRAFRWGRVPLMANRVLAVNKGSSEPEDTLHIRTNSCDIVVTPDHTMVGQVRRTKVHKSTTRRGGKSWTCSTLYAQKTTGLERFSAGDLPARTKIPCGGWITGRQGSKLSKDWFWLMGFIVGDGNVSRRKNEVVISQSFCPKKTKYARKIPEVLDRLGLRYRFYVKKAGGLCFGYERNGPVGQWVLSGADAARVRDVFDRGCRRRYSNTKSFRRKTHKGSHGHEKVQGWKAIEKAIPAWVLRRASPTQMLSLLKGLLESDGSGMRMSKRSRNHTNGCYWTGERALADRLQAMLSLCGFRSAIKVHKVRHGKDQLCVLLSNPATSDVTKNVCVKPGPKSLVWCPSTELGTVLCRRNGRTFIAGNSKDDWSFTYILDSGFEFFMAKHGKMVPGWAKAAFKRYGPKEIRRD